MTSTDRPDRVLASVPSRVVLDRAIGSHVATAAGDPTVPGERLRRLRQRKRLMREELAALGLLLLALGVTVAVLASQWLGSGGTSSSLGSSSSAGAVPEIVHISINLGSPGGIT
jgi:hypothetical protein